jgi:hypothetical protein
MPRARRTVTANNGTDRCWWATIGRVCQRLTPGSVTVRPSSSVQVVTQLDETTDLGGGELVDAAAVVQRLAGDHAHAAAAHAGQTGPDGRGERRAQLEERAVVDEGVDDRADVVGAVVGDELGDPARSRRCRTGR